MDCTPVCETPRTSRQPCRETLDFPWCMDVSQRGELAADPPDGLGLPHIALAEEQLNTHTASFSQFSFWCLWSAGKTDEIFRWSCCLFIPAQRYSDIADRFASHLWGGVRLSLSYVSGNFCRLLSAVCHMQIWSLSFTLQGSNQGDRFVSSEGGSVDPAGRHVYSSEKVEEGAVRWFRGCAVDGGREVKKGRRKHFVV